MTAPTVDSWAVVARAQAGDREAFGEIYRTHYDRVFRFLHHRFRLDPETASDLTQDTFLRALRSIGTVTWQGRGIESWLYTIARNLHTDHFKSSRIRRQSSHTIDDLIEYRVEPVAVDDPAFDVELSELAGVLVDAMDRLTPAQKQCVLLRFQADLSTQETADVLGIEVGATKALQYRAVRALAGDKQIRALAEATR